MNKQIVLSRKSWFYLLAVTFLVALSVRIVEIKLTPMSDFTIDLDIYRSGGELMLRGVNPYDFAASPDFRAQLHREAHDSFLREITQLRWDYYASGNLPMNLLFFKALSSICDTPSFYRYSFAFMDSILCAVLAWFVILHWQGQGWLARWLVARGVGTERASLMERLVVAASIGCLSPVLAKYGTGFPEDKGIQILLMVAALGFLSARNERLWFWGGAVSLGLSISFKGLGIFLVPLAIARLAKNPSRLWSRAALFFAVVAVLIFAWFPPFWPGVAVMIKARLFLASTLEAQHFSMWLLPSQFLPTAWRFLRVALALMILAISFFAYFRRRIPLALLCVNCLLTFVVVWLINGSLDRQNIALIPALLVLGTVNVDVALVCLVPYLLTGVVAFARHEAGVTAGSVGIFVFVITYTIVLIRLASRTRSEERA
jgi:hypothetical protein